MKKNINYSLFILVIMLFIGLLGFSYFMNNDEIFDISKDTNMVSIFKNEVDFSSISQPYLLHFFASWCQACSVDHSLLLKYKDAFPIYAVASLDEPNRVTKYLAKYHNPYINVVEDKLGTLAKHFKVSGLPETILVNNNKIVLRIKGNIKKSDLDKKIIPFF